MSLILADGSMNGCRCVQPLSVDGGADGWSEGITTGVPCGVPEGRTPVSTPDPASPNATPMTTTAAAGTSNIQREGRDM
jgi:hypothetical protein